MNLPIHPTPTSPARVKVGFCYITLNSVDAKTLQRMLIIEKTARSGSFRGLSISRQSLRFSPGRNVGGDQDDGRGYSWPCSER